MNLIGKSFIRAAVAATLLLRVCVSVSAEDSPMPPKEAILNRVHAFTGLDTMFEVESIETVPAADANIPFLSKDSEKAAIKVTFKRGALKLKTAPHSADKFERQFVVLLDPTAAYLLSVISSGPKDSPDIHREPPEKVERMLRNHGELYESLPASDPKVTFLNALEIIQKDGVGSPLVHQEIEGFYVIQSQFDVEMNRPKSAKWIISLRGGPPDSSTPEFLPNWARGRIREFVDATSGKWLGANSFP